MTAEKFLDKLAELMDTESKLNLETKLADVEDWDSLSMVSFFSFCNTTLKRHVTPDEIKSAKTIADLFKLVGGDSL